MQLNLRQIEVFRGSISGAAKMLHVMVACPVVAAPTLTVNMVHARFEPLSQTAQSFVEVLRAETGLQGFGLSERGEAMIERGRPMPTPAVALQLTA